MKKVICLKLFIIVLMYLYYIIDEIWNSYERVKLKGIKVVIIWKYIYYIGMFIVMWKISY